MGKILIIDDDGIVRDALSVFLTRSGHRVLTAADGANGVLVFQNSLPDLVVLDRDLPVMSGSKVFAGIRKISATTPIIMLSGFNDPEEVDEYLRGGAAAFLSKGGGLAPVLDTIDRLLGAQSKEGPSAPAAPGKAAPLVLIAEDDLQMRTVLRRFVGSLPCETLEAEDGAQAVELARAHKPDIVLLDISMPGKTGVEALEELRPELPETGFLMISGNNDEDTARDCLRIGAFDYIAKPVNLAALGEILKARLLLQKPRA